MKEATLGKLTQVLAARDRGLDAGREKLKAMQAAKSQLEVDVANMEARLEMVKVAQSTSEFNFDDMVAPAGPPIASPPVPMDLDDAGPQTAWDKSNPRIDIAFWL